MRRRCEMPFNMLKIEMDGSIYMCSSGQPANLNAFEVDPLEIWNSSRFKELRRQLDTEDYDDMCLQCPLVQDFNNADAESEALRVAALNYRIMGNAVLDAARQPIGATDHLNGWVDAADLTSKTLTLAGWAADVERNVPCKAVVVFINDIARAASCPSGLRNDVSAALNKPQIRLSGYSIAVPIPTGLTATDMKVRVFGLDADGSVGELSYPQSHEIFNRPL